jgi:hypothetical protein
MTTTVRRRKQSKRSGQKKKRKPSGDRRVPGMLVTMVHPRAARSRRSRISREVVGLRCRVIGVHPEAEAIVLSDFYGRQVLVPVTSAEQDGHLVRDISGLVGMDVWLSLRLP